MTRKSKHRKQGEKRKSSPHFPNTKRREIEPLNPKTSIRDEEQNYEIDSDEVDVVYELKEAVPEAESRRNRRYDPVDNFKYKLPKQFKDEYFDSDDEDDNDDFDATERNLEGDSGEEDDEGRHSRMLQEITGLPSDAFDGKKKQNNIVISEAYPENEYNPSGDILGGDGHVSIHDLLDPLCWKTGFNKLKKRVHQMETKLTAIHAPLPNPDREKLEKMPAYEQLKKDITKWEPLVNGNRKAPTMYFEEDSDLHFPSIGTIASEFGPRTEFEKRMAAVVTNSEVSEAHHKDGARLFELNKISEEDVKGHQDHLAKMRHLLYRSEMKAKRIKKIKSKIYHRLKKKDRLKAAASQIETDPEAAKKRAMKQEFEWYLEHATLKHKNRGKWAKHIQVRGLSVQDEGTRAAVSEQLHQHAVLTRKMNSLRNDSNSDETSEEDDDGISAGSDDNGGLKLLERAKKKTLELLEDDEIPQSGVLSLPFMVCGLEKRKVAAEVEAKHALQEYETSLMQSKDKEYLEAGTSSGRRVFGALKHHIQGSSEKIRLNYYYGNTDSEDDHDTKEDVDVGRARRSYSHKDVAVDPYILREKSEIGHDNLVKNIEGIVTNTGTKMTSNSWKKKQNLPQTTKQLKRKTEVDVSGTNSSQELENDNDIDGNFTMVDGILSAADQSNYDLPSQADLIRRAFAGDDVDEEFENDKEKILHEESPELDKPVSLPGWGQWTNVQKKRGLPSWMAAEHENAKKKRLEALKKMKDAHLKNVIISEKVDKKDEKLHTKTLPFPYTSKEVFEQSIRMPIGPEYNPATAIGALNHPEVAKKSGMIIKPIIYEDVNSYERAEEHKHSGKNQTAKKPTGKNQNKMKLTGRNDRIRVTSDLRKSLIQ